MSYLDEDIAAAEARLAQLREDRARREAAQEERAAELSLSEQREANYNEERTRQEQRFADRFNSAPRDAYGQRLGISPAEVAQYASSRFSAHVRSEMQFWHDLSNRPLSELRGR